MASPNSLPIEVCFLPADLGQRHLTGRAVVVFDVLRATTSITAALDARVKSIRIFATSADVLCAGPAYSNALLCGEEKCLPPPGFHLGNSPAAFRTSLHAGREMLMSTTNGTRAILAARGAARIYTGALVNAAAVARRLAQDELPITLLCAGTNGAVAMEDVLGAGAVIATLRELIAPIFESDSAIIADRLFSASRSDLPAILRLTRGGLNLIEAGLESDIDYVARLNVLDTVGVVSADNPPVITSSSARY